MFSKERGMPMDTTTVIQVVAGVLFVIVLIVLIQRRRTRVK
jgi:high-affinity Fe2+/Pb2+ permease